MKKLFKRFASWILDKEIAAKDNTIDHLYTKLREEQQRFRTEVHIRIPRSEYDRLKGKLQQSVITNTTTDLQAAALVGQQRVLDLLEQEIVSG